MLAPAGVAVNAVTHDVYVADSGNARVDEFTAAGVFVRAWGWGVGDGVSTELQTCVLVTCFKGLSGHEPGEFEAPVFIAVDNSPGGEGDVYVGDTGDNLVTKFTSEGALVKTWGTNGQLNGSTTTSGTIAPIAGITVDAAGNLDVLQQSGTPEIYQFEQNDTFTSEFPTERSAAPEGLAADEAGDLFKILEGGIGVQEIPGGTVREEGVASGVAAAGSDLYVVESGLVAHYSFLEPTVVSETQTGAPPCTIGEDSPCPASDSFGSEHLTDGSGVGVDPSNGAVFVTEAAAGVIDRFEPTIVPEVTTSAANPVRPLSATLNGIVDPEGVALTGCEFEYVAQEQYEPGAPNPYAAGGTAACVPDPAEIGSSAVPAEVHASINGLAPGGTYDFRVRAENANGIPSPGHDVTFITQPRPVITNPAASAVSATSATLEADVNPGGLPTTYQIEYGTSTEYGHSAPAAPVAVGEGTSPVAVSQQVTGLEPDTTYHWRVVASNEAGSTTSTDHTFVYDETATTTLPDERAYEMVTPPHKDAALIGNVPLGKPAVISEDGTHVILDTLQCFDGSPSCVPAGRQAIGVPYMFTRTSAGWQASSLAPPATRFETDTSWLYSADSQTAFFGMPTPPGGEDDIYARSPTGVFTDIGPFSAPADGPTSVTTLIHTERWTGSADLSHFVYWAQPVWPFSETLQEDPTIAAAVFQYVGSGNAQPALVGVSGGLGSTSVISECRTELGNKAPGLAGNESANGRVVYFTAEECSQGTGVNEGVAVPTRELFARVDGGEAGAHTVAISEPQAPQAPSENQPEANCESVSCVENTSAGNTGAWRKGAFLGTTSDGSVAYFTSEQQLTDTASEGSSNLYAYDFNNPAGQRLVDVSAAEGGGPVAGGPRVQGVLAYSNEGSNVYFVAQGVLTSVERPGCKAEFEAARVAEEGRCRARDGAENLYAYSDGRVAFVAAMSPEDAGEQFGGPPGNPSNVSPNGQFLVFTTRAAVTPGVTRVDGGVQVFRYDAVSGGLLRLSFGEGGFNDDGNGGVGSASIVPGYEGYDQLGAARPDPTMADDGQRVFFMSPVALTAKALSSVPIGTGEKGLEYAENVYEWEQAGVGSCSAGSTGGCVFLISDGRDTSVLASGEACTPKISGVCLLGSDASGVNVFFTTADRLVAADTDTQLDVYDARVCEPEAGDPCIASAPAELPGCLGEACYGIPPQEPAGVSPGSASFSGPGNPPPAAVVKPAAKVLSRAQKLAAALKVCKRDRVKRRRVVCERAARKRYAPARKAAKTR